jgi:hypothetical protein
MRTRTVNRAGRCIAVCLAALAEGSL